MEIIDMINAKLRAAGMSGAELARRIGVSTGVYSQWNTKRTEPSNQNLIKIASVLNCEVEDLMPGSEEEPEALGSIDDVFDILQTFRDRPEMRMLFDAGRKATPETVRQTAKFLEGLAKGEKTD